ncbi:FkbM family methyltransferase [Thiorhodovibrio litoralis]|uniref:FkbM family methyltransferase n=1 Tax=Thiorhodovibrio litoralis TaxID=2952932 RepID=UPI002B25B371|nr:FkbM family methyltransferase [Thiorhodovibrio litoralis]WPL11522.1 methyltransferase, FkbM family [Thiorhodovibrio litoralis]
MYLKPLPGLFLEVRRVSTQSNSTCQLVTALQSFDIDLIFDVGANRGQFGLDLRRFGYNKHIVSFEPLSIPHNIATQNADKDQSWYVHERTAIGDTDGEIEVKVSNNSYSSSILQITDTHCDAAKNSEYVGTERTPILRLDSVAPLYLDRGQNPLLKIDTQGYEWQVLDGASETLPKIRGILCELSFVSLYQGSRLWTDVVQRLEKEGFKLWALSQEFIHPDTGRTLQSNGLFFRTHY